MEGFLPVQEFYKQAQSEGSEPGSSKVKVVDIFNLLIGIIGILGNTLVCIILIKDKKFHKIAFYFILNLAIADLLTCFALIFFNFMFNFIENAHLAPDTIGGLIYCKLIFRPHLIYIYFSQTSVFCLVSVAIERYVSLSTLSKTEMRHLTKKHAIILMILPWVGGIFSVGGQTTHFGVVNGQCEVLFMPYQQVRSTIMFLSAYVVPSIIMVALYARLIYLLKKQKQNLSRANEEQNPAVTTMTFATRRITTIVIIVTVAFIILWLPKSVALYWFLVSNADITYYIFNIEPYLFFISNINNIINPIIYIIGFKGFRRAFKIMFLAPILRVLGRQTDAAAPDLTRARRSSLATSV